MILLFGGNGQLGQELADLATRRGVALRALSRAQADIADHAAVVQAFADVRPSMVVNAAAYTAVDKAEGDSEAAALANVTGPAILAEACAGAQVPLVHVSTDYVFDGSKAGAYVETDPVAPLGVYGRTKADGEQAVRERLREHIILRTSWVYGVYGRNILKTVLKLAQERDELRFVADQRGCPTSTMDIAEAILRIGISLAEGEPPWGVYHFAGTGATTWYEFVRHVVAVQAELTGRHPAVQPIATAEYPTPARRPANSELDSTWFASVFGWRAEPWRTRAESIVRRLVEERAGAAA